MEPRPSKISGIPAKLRVSICLGDFERRRRLHFASFRFSSILRAAFHRMARKFLDRTCVTLSLTCRIFGHVRAPSRFHLRSPLPPDQDRVNWAGREIAIAASKGPPFQPYLNPKLSERPWIPADLDPGNARKRWIGFSKKAKRNLAPKELTVQDFTLYHLRVLFCRRFM